MVYKRFMRTYTCDRAFMARIHCSKQFTNAAMSQILTTSHPIQKRVYFVSLTMYHHKRISVSMAKNSWTYHKYTEISYPHKNSVGTFWIQWHHCEACLKGMVTSRVKGGQHPTYFQVKFYSFKIHSLFFFPLPSIFCHLFKGNSHPLLWWLFIVSSRTYKISKNRFLSSVNVTVFFVSNRTTAQPFPPYILRHDPSVYFVYLEDICSKLVRVHDEID